MTFSDAIDECLFVDAFNQTDTWSIELTMHPLPSAPSRTQTILLSVSLVFIVSGLAVAQEKQSHMPDPKLTPGDTIAITKEDVCGTGHTAHADAIPVKVKGQVFARYGISTAGPTSYNIDHLIPVKLGGSSSITNLWPQPLSGEWNYVLKNKLEKQLEKKVCRGELELSKAQQEIATDWVAAYKKYVVEAKRSRRKPT